MAYSQNGRSVAARPKAISGPEASIWKGCEAEATASGGMMSASIAGNSGTTTDATLRAEDFRAFKSGGAYGLCRMRQATREIGSVQLNRNRPNQAGCGQPDRVERGVNRQIDAEQAGELNHAGCKQMEQRRIVFVVRPQVGGRADAFAEDLADEVIVRGRVDFVQWVRPSGGTVREPSPYDRSGERDADDGTDRQCDAG